MELNLTPDVFIGCLFFVCFLIVYFFVKVIVYSGEIKVEEHGTNKYVFTIISIVVIAIIFTVIILLGLKMDNSINLLDYLLKCLGIT